MRCAHMQHGATICTLADNFLFLHGKMISAILFTPHIDLSIVVVFEHKRWWKYAVGSAVLPR